jgi:hypothetical protein
MQRKALLGLMILALAGCAGTATSPPPQPSFVGIVGTPWLIALKIPVCTATILMAGPVAAVATLSNPGLDGNLAASDTRYDLDRGLNENCGPPYVVTP